MTPQELKVAAMAAANTSASIANSSYGHLSMVGNRPTTTMQEILAHAKVIHAWFEADASKVPPAGEPPRADRHGWESPHTDNNRFPPPTMKDPQ